MELSQPGAGIYVPDGTDVADALSRTTHLGIGAHQDDLEIMAYHGIVQCFGVDDKWFTGITCTNGGGAPRDALYADYTDEMMQVVRRKEQDKAANLGEFSAQVALDYPSSGIKNAAETDVVEDLKNLISATTPQVIYTHNLADKHDTHVGVVLRVITALRELPGGARPEQLIACEVWRDLDWLRDEDKVTMDVAAHDNLASALMALYDSQVCGGKRYDLAAMGRRRANATFFASHGVDDTEAMIYGMDLMPLLADASKCPLEYVKEYMDRFYAEVADRVGKLS
ncbi:MAG TPA: PIG-L family deacetylase [Armatimonadota bacterium]|nr:PIG-L family deacetylase [Armatimonadota bacterium]